jgi:hypothetical protein
MISTFQAFYTKHPQELADTARLKRVLRTSDATPLWATLLFAVFGLLSFGAAVLILVAAWQLKSIGIAVGAIVIALPIGLSLVWASKLFFKERRINPLRNYFKDPQKFDFADGEIFDATFQESSKQSKARIFVKGRAKIQGDWVSFFFYATPSAWQSLEARMPIKVKVIYEIAVPAHCNLVSIEKTHSASIQS